MKVYEYVVIYTPNEDRNDNGDVRKKAKLLVDVTRVLCENMDQANILAARDIPEEYLDRLDEVEVAVRPF